MKLYQDLTNEEKEEIFKGIEISTSKPFLNKKVPLVLISGTLAVSILAIFLSRDNITLIAFDSNINTITLAGFTAIGALTLVLFLYLESGLKKSVIPQISVRSEIAELRAEIQKLRKKAGLNDQITDYDKTVSELLEAKFTPEYIQNSIEKTFSTYAIDNAKQESLNRLLIGSSQRLDAELLRLKNNATLNLFIGIIATLTAIGSLFIIVAYSTLKSNDPVILVS